MGAESGAGSKQEDNDGRARMMQALGKLEAMNGIDALMHNLGDGEDAGSQRLPGPPRQTLLLQTPGQDQGSGSNEQIGQDEVRRPL